MPSKIGPMTCNISACMGCPYLAAGLASRASWSLQACQQASSKTGPHRNLQPLNHVAVQLKPNFGSFLPCMGFSARQSHSVSFHTNVPMLASCLQHAQAALQEPGLMHE